jgi:Regulator of chromosome condensation (RCC1) repeat
VYACGANDCDRLGLGDGQDRDSWQQVEVPGLARMMAVGVYHSFLQLETGEVYSCGHNYHGQLGAGRHPGPGRLAASADPRSRSDGGDRSEPFSPSASNRRGVRLWI